MSRRQKHVEVHGALYTSASGRVFFCDASDSPLSEDDFEVKIRIPIPDSYWTRGGIPIIHAETEEVQPEPRQPGRKAGRP